MSEVDQLIQENKELKANLRDKEILFNHIVESTFSGYFDWNIKEKKEYWSPTLKKMFGYENHELYSSPITWQRLIYQEDLPIVFDQMDAHIKSRGKIPFDCKMRFHHKQGFRVWIFCQVKIVEWNDLGRPIRIVGSLTDITDIKNIQETEAYVEQLESRNKELQQFAYVASHDLQEPLRTIISFTEHMSEEYKDRLDETAKTYLKYITGASHRMSELVKGLLDYTRIGKNFKIKKIDPNKILEAVLQDLHSLLENKNVKIEIEKLPKINGLETEIRSVFMNLISNAVKYSKKNVTPIIKIGAIKDVNVVKFFVEDNGIGIEKAYLKRIFLIFQRLHNKNEYEGTGIGLAHCQKIIELHGGKIWAESIPNLGSSFFFTIPA